MAKQPNAKPKTSAAHLSNLEASVKKQLSTLEMVRAMQAQKKGGTALVRNEMDLR